MRSIASILIFAAILVLSACSTNQDAEESQVYAAYVDSTFKNAADSQDPIRVHVIDDATIGYSGLLRSLPEFPMRPDESTIKDYFSRNGIEDNANAKHAELSYKRYPLRNLHFQKPHILLSDSEQKQIFDDSEDLHFAWVKFHKRFPGSHGILQFSCIGFNRNRTQALFYMGNQWDSEAGNGCFVLMGKSDGHWKPIAEVGLWAS